MISELCSRARTLRASAHIGMKYKQWPAVALCIIVSLIFAQGMGCKVTSPRTDATALKNSGNGHASTVMLIGGGNYHQNDDRIAKEFLKLIGELGRGAPAIGIVTAASDKGDVRDDGQFYERFLGGLGAKAEWLDLERASRDKEYEAALAARTSNMNGFFFGGGSQNKIAEALFEPSSRDRVPSKVLLAIQQAFNSGAVYAGTSAGSVIASGKGVPMFLSGGNYLSMGMQNISERADDANHDPGFKLLVVDFSGGLDLFRFGAIDTHFSERNRLIRSFAMGSFLSRTVDADATVAIAEGKLPLREFGVDEGTALIVHQANGKRPTMEVVGVGGVSIITFTQSSFSKQPCDLARAAQLTFLTDGDSFDPLNGRVAFAPAKTVLDQGAAPTEAAVVVSGGFGSPADLLSGTERSPSELKGDILHKLNDFIKGGSAQLTIQSADPTAVYSLIVTQARQRVVLTRDGEDTLYSWSDMGMRLECPPQ